MDFRSGQIFMSIIYAEQTGGPKFLFVRLGNLSATFETESLHILIF